MNYLPEASPSIDHRHAGERWGEPHDMLAGRYEMIEW
jgi:hypothetical protein